MKELPWTAFKSFASARSLSIQYIDIDDHYYMWALDGLIHFECSIYKNNPDTTDKLDFENNFKAAGNRSFSDSDGIIMNRQKMFKSGVAVRFHFTSFETAKLSSLYHKKSDGTDYNYCVYKIYDSNDAEITQQQNEANAVKTVIDWEPPSISYEVIGGAFYQNTQASSNIYVWCVGVPDVSEAYGGSIPFAVGANLKHMNAGQAFVIDGRVPKTMNYNATYHTSKFRFVFKHDAGVQHQASIRLDIAY